MQAGLLEEMGENHFLMTEVPELVGSETASAQRVREHRERQKTGLIESDSQAKSNAQRQKMFRAKEKCKEKQHVPFIEDYINNKRYGGNYYIVIKRDKYKCACCGSIENLCVHHIDGYDESKPENNNANKLITLCRECHSKIHAGAKIEEDILESIDYYSNEMLPSNTDVTEVKQLCNVEKDREKDREKDKDKIKEDKIKHTYGEYKHVRLTDIEYTKLCDEYGDIKAGECITYLDEYIEMKGYKAKNHYLCIRKWVANAVDEHKGKNNQRSANKVADKLNESYDLINQWVHEREG
jgi:5-methylcytosine-specific restriction endonuclease McrA